MSLFSAINQKLRFSKLQETFRKSGSAVVEFLSRDDADVRNFQRKLPGMVKMVLVSESGEISAENWTFLRVVADYYSPSQSIVLLKNIQDADPLTPDETVDLLQKLLPEERKKVVHFLIALSVAGNLPPERSIMVGGIAEKLGFSSEEVAQIVNNLLNAKQNHMPLVRSGAGILIVIGIIIVFLLLATWLRPVVFGLIAAYLLLPLEKFFERRLREKRGFGYRVSQLLHGMVSPLYRLSAKIKSKLHHTGDEPVTENQKARECERKVIAQAVGETLFFVFVAIVLLFTVFSNLVFTQVRDAGQAVGNWMMQSDDAPYEEMPQTSPFAPMVTSLNRAAHNFSKIPPVQSMIQSVSNVLSNPQKMREMMHLLLQKSGGVFSVTAGVVGITIGIFCDFLLTLFFVIFFLSKLAEFCRSDESTDRQGEYLVRMLYNGKWLPGANEATLNEATRLVSGIFLRLRIWIRGYMTLILLDMTVFTFFFCIIGVPYFPIVGLIAGCSQLLPYIGPILTELITLVVTLACGGSGTQLMLIIVLYLIYNVILEQFVIYPAIIGDSLGLTTLETIIVVLIGAIVAGIPGMILAMPTASVAKYLVPQVYRCLDVRREALLAEQNKIRPIGGSK